MQHEVSEVRISVSITLPKEVVEWLDHQVETRTYHNRSHAIEVIILEKMKEKRKGSE